MSETEHDKKPLAREDSPAELLPPTSPEAQDGAVAQPEAAPQSPSAGELLSEVPADTPAEAQADAPADSQLESPIESPIESKVESKVESPNESSIEPRAEAQAGLQTESPSDTSLESPLKPTASQRPAPLPPAGQPAKTPASKTQAPKAQAAKTQAPAAKASGGKGLLWFFVLLLVIATGGLGWLVWQQQTQLLDLQAVQDNTGSRDAAVLARVQALESLRDSLDAQLRQQDERFEARGAQQAERLGSLQQDVLNMRLQRNTDVPTPASVLLAEARGLLRLGRERVLADQDIESAVGLYLAADEVLMIIDDPGIQLIRQTLQRETDTLRGVRMPDIAALHAQLGQLKAAVETLPLGSDPNTGLAGFASAGRAAEEEAGGWMNSLKAGLSRYFVLSRQAEPVRPRISDEGVALLRLDISLQLEQARLALMQGDTRLYQQTIDATAASIRSWAESSAAAPLLTSLEALRSASLMPDLPPLGAALNALRSLSGGASTLEEQP